MSKTIFPLIKRNVGEVTYEHSYVQALPRDVIIAAAERNLYVDEHHEINLCAYWNSRIAGTYQFDNKYSFYVTDGRLCITIWRNLGDVSECHILKKFESLEDAKGSEYYDDFCKLKLLIEKSVKTQKNYMEKREKNIFDWSTMSARTYPDCEGGDYEWICTKTKEFVQLHVDLTADKWILTTSKESLSEIKGFFKDFEELDKNELHLRTFHNELDVKNLDKSSPYYEIVKTAKEELGLSGGLVPDKIDFEQIEYMEFQEGIVYYDSEANKVKRSYAKKTKIELNGLITECKTLENCVKVRKISKHTVSSEYVENAFRQIVDFLSSGRLKENVFCDDSYGSLKIYFKDGHSEKYDRGLSRNNVHLRDFLCKLLRR